MCQASKTAPRTKSYRRRSANTVHTPLSVASGLITQRVQNASCHSGKFTVSEILAAVIANVLRNYFVGTFLPGVFKEYQELPYFQSGRQHFPSLMAISWNWSRYLQGFSPKDCKSTAPKLLGSLTLKHRTLQMTQHRGLQTVSEFARRELAESICTSKIF